MPQVEELKIFLASPSDVPTEKDRYVDQVIDEINRTVASDKGVVLRVFRSGKNTFPSYGEDGQAVVNEQIGKMGDYSLFIGIMWNRIGTATPRAESGTVEEFELAVKALKKKGQPQIWFYFRQSAARLNTVEELEQRRKVLAFRTRVQRRSKRGSGALLTCDYDKPADFRDKFREHILLWLSKRGSKTSISRAATSSSRNKSPTKPANSQSSTRTADSRNKSSLTSTAKKRSPASSRSTTAPKSVSSSGDWALVNDNLFLTESVDTQENQSVTLRISPATPEQKAVLRNLQPDRFDKKQVTYAHEDEAAIMQVESICSSSSKGKTTFVLTLKPAQQSQGNSMEVNLSGYSADEIAKLRARLLLLNETPNIQSKNESSWINSYVEGYDNTVKIKKSIFPDLWKQLKTQPQLFLYHARLAAVYHLKMSRTIEHILELKLSLIKGNVMSIRFRGQRKQAYGQEPAVIEVIGNCHLEA
jgi:hypothetical protein